MLAVFAYKRCKKHKLTKQLREQNATEALSKQDEAFIRKSINDNHKNPEQGKPL
jgi:phage shock protein A